MMTNLDPAFEGLKSKLRLSADGRLTLNGLPMILLPRHFFRYLMREVQKMVGAKAFHEMSRKVGYEGAVTFCEAFQKSHGGSAKEALIGYFDEMSIRGWGHFTIEKLDEINGQAEVLLTDSALPAEGDLPSGDSIWEGAVLGAMSYVQNNTCGIKRRAEAVAGQHAAKGSGYTITVMPAGNCRNRG
jgi:hypothetical protein